MALVLLIAVGAAALALVLGGSWKAFVSVPIKGARLVVIAVGAQLVGGWLAELTNLGGFYAAGLVLSALAAAAFCWRNRQVVGLALITAGVFFNALAVSANGAMPVSAHAADRAGVSMTTIAAGDDPRHEIADTQARLRPLTDVIPVPLPWFPEVISVGDVLIAAGIGELVFFGMWSPRRRRDEEPTTAARRPSAVASR